MKKNSILSAFLSVALLTAMGFVSQACAQSEVGPLLGNIKWNQFETWNQTIPKDPDTSPARSAKPMPAGSLAVAMGQVMCYYKWPEQMMGAKTSYYHDDNKHFGGIKVEEDFSNSTYDWSAISETDVTDGASDLLYKIGVATNTDWRASGSNGELSNRALGYYFRYFANPAFSTVSKPNWQEIVKAEIDAKRPVLMAYYDMDALKYSAVVVVDGYNSEGYFHLNVGNSGWGNGYYELDPLLTDAMIVTGIEPNKDPDLDKKLPVGVIPENSDIRTSTPIQLSELGHLVWLQDQVDCRAVTSISVCMLMDDIDAADTAQWIAPGSQSPAIAGFQPIGSDENGIDKLFRGSFNGLGKKILNLTMNTSASDAGLFGVVAPGSRVQYVGLENVSFVADGSSTSTCGGALVGLNQGLVEQCYVTGTVSGTAVDPEWDSIIGGLVGWNTGIVRDCYSQASVDSTVSFYAGGTVGLNEGFTDRCYFAGKVYGAGLFTSVVGVNVFGNDVEDCFWDYQLAEQFTQDRFARTTADMKSQALYTNWDFNAVWQMRGYPVLKVFNGSVGELLVNIQPEDAVANGALWTLDAGKTWHDSAVPVILPEGTYTLDYSDASGYLKPLGGPIDVVADETATTTPVYTAAAANLNVIINPVPTEEDPYADDPPPGSQWTVDDINWHNSNDLVSVPAGFYMVKFNDVPGWTKPDDKGVTVTSSMTETSGVYTAVDPDKGNLRVLIAPAPAVQQGAMWSVDGTNWYASGDTVRVSSGTQTIRYRNIGSNWQAPADEEVQVLTNKYTDVTARYTPLVATISVNLLPQAAVLAGAQWSIDNGATWNDSGAVVTVKTAGVYTVICKGGLGGWAPPSARNVSVDLGDAAGLTCTYTVMSGSVKVTLNPENAGIEGAQWRLTNLSTSETLPWMNSGDTLKHLDLGDYWVDFKDIPGWGSPAGRQITISNDTVVELTGVYLLTRTQGKIITFLAPDNVTSAAGWRLSGETDWRKTGESLDLEFGTYLVEFADVPDYNTPASQMVFVRGADVTVVNATYTQGVGSIKVSIVPSGAVSSNAKWSIDNGATWYGSGQTVSGLATGSYTVLYKPVNGWAAPAPATLDVTAGSVTSAVGTYTANSQTGSLLISALPADVSAVAAWSIDNGKTWRACDVTMDRMPVGSYYVEFRALAGWVQPQPRFVTVTANTTTKDTGTYTKIPIPADALDIVLDGSDVRTYTNYQTAGSEFDFTWYVSTNETFTSSTWAEIFASKTGGFDLVRLGATMTASKVVNGLFFPTQSIKSTEVLNALPDGKYTMVASINRATLPVPIPETNYSNNWAPLAGKQLLVQNPSASLVDLQLVQPVSFVIDPNDPEVVTAYGKIVNKGTQAATGGFWMEVFYGNMTAEGTLEPFGTVAPGLLYNGLAAGAQAEFYITGRVPGGVVRKGLSLQVDSTDLIPESNETNNSKLWFYPSILPVNPKPSVSDLKIEKVEVLSQLAPATIAPGENVRVAVTVKNLGNDCPNVWLELFVSQDGGVSFMRGATLTDSMVISAPGYMQSKTYLMDQPIRNIGDGIYSLVAVVNRQACYGNVGDMTPLDNRMVFNGGRVSVCTPLMDNTANLVWADGPYFLNQNGMMYVTGVVRNDGTTATGPFWTEAFEGMMEPKTGFFTRGNQVGGGVYCPGLQPDATQGITISGPVKSGVVVGVMTDSTDMVPETDETDNYDYSELTK